jgi:XapX domain-containing protein
MKPYLLSLGAGFLIGAIYALLNVRSPAPPVIALLGLLGILLGEQAVPFAKRLTQRHSAEPVVTSGTINTLPDADFGKSGDPQHGR